MSRFDSFLMWLVDFSDIYQIIYYVIDMQLMFYCVIFSSPEHEVLMVSYCGQWVVRRASTFDVYTLETTFVIQFL